MGSQAAQLSHSQLGSSLDHGVDDLLDLDRIGEGDDVAAEPHDHRCLVDGHRTIAHATGQTHPPRVVHRRTDSGERGRRPGCQAGRVPRHPVVAGKPRRLREPTRAHLRSQHRRQAMGHLADRLRLLDGIAEPGLWHRPDWCVARDEAQLGGHRRQPGREPGQVVQARQLQDVHRRQRHRAGCRTRTAHRPGGDVARSRGSCASLDHGHCRHGSIICSTADSPPRLSTPLSAAASARRRSWR